MKKNKKCKEEIYITNGVDIAPVRLRLRMLKRITIYLAGAG